MVDLYLGGASLEQAARFYGYKKGDVCRRALEEHGFMPRSWYATDKQQKKMIENYVQGFSMTESAAREGFTRIACLTALERFGVPIRANQGNRKYEVDDSFFDTIATEAQAYWLGMSSADGCVLETSVSLKLQQRDRNHLHKFREALRATSPLSDGVGIKGGKIYTYSKLQVFSKRLVLSLSDLGVERCKTTCLCPCTKVPVPLQRHYWRGFVDGDGGISKRRANPRVWSVELDGTRMVVEAFMEFVKTKVFSKARARPKGNHFQGAFAGMQLPQMVAYLLYGNATVFLDRKKENVDRLLSIPTKFTTWLNTALDDELETWFEHGERMAA